MGLAFDPDQATRIQSPTSGEQVALGLGRIIGLLEGEDCGYSFQLMSEHVAGAALYPSTLAIEVVLLRLREKFRQGWRLVPPEAPNA